MADNKNMNEEDFDEVVVSFKDENGEEILYMQEMIIPVNGQDYALLIGIDDNTDDGIRRDEEGEEDVIIAKIVKDADGEDEYVDPTDEEFEAVQKAYNDMMDEMEAGE